MTREEAWQLLESERTHDRLRGARELARGAAASDKARLVAALGRETVVWIRKALEAAIERADGGERPGPLETVPWDELEPDIAAYARGSEDGVRSLLHELTPILGLLRLSLASEITDYRNSKSKRHLESLLSLVTAVKQLNEAATEVVTVEFDLASRVRAAAQAVSEELQHDVQFAGPEPLMVEGSPHLIELVVKNALRNAVESEQAAGISLPVLVSWDQTDRETWITVLDRGVGLPAGSEHAFAIGRTSKASHAGMGLAIVERAAQSLFGRVTLSPREGGGVAFELRWPRKLLG